MRLQEIIQRIDARQELKVDVAEEEAFCGSKYNNAKKYHEFATQYGDHEVTFIAAQVGFLYLVLKE